MRTFDLERIEQRQLIADLVALQYKRIQSDFARGTFRVRGDVIELFPGVEIGRVGALSSTRPVDNASILGDAPTMTFRVPN